MKYNNNDLGFNDKILSSNQDIANAFNNQFVKVANNPTHKSYRKITREVRKINSSEFIITHEQLIKAIKDSKNKNSTGPDNINIKHLKHLGPRALDYLLNIYILTISTNEIPSIWKTAKIIPIAKPNKNIDEGTSYRPISLLSPIAKTLEKILLPIFTDNIQNEKFQHGFKKVIQQPQLYIK